MDNARVDILCYATELRKLRRRPRRSPPRVVDCIVGVGFGGRGVSRQGTQLRGAVERAGLVANHFARPLRSVTCSGSTSERADAAEATQGELSVSPTA